MYICDVNSWYIHWVLVEVLPAWNNFCCLYQHSILVYISDNGLLCCSTIDMHTTHMHACMHTTYMDTHTHTAVTVAYNVSCLSQSLVELCRHFNQGSLFSTAVNVRPSDSLCAAWCGVSEGVDPKSIRQSLCSLVWGVRRRRPKDHQTVTVQLGVGCLKA